MNYESGEKKKSGLSMDLKERLFISFMALKSKNRKRLRKKSKPQNKDIYP